MKVTSIITVLLTYAVAAHAFTIPNVFEKREAPLNELFKRKGGGGGGKGGSSGSSSSSSGSSSSGSSSSSSGAGARTGSTSNAGGATSAGSGAPRSYGGGRYYGGGATTPYSAGGRSPKGIAPIALLGVGGLAFLGTGAFLYGAYMYPYARPYGFYNATARQNQTKPVNCLCQQYSVCGCDDNDDDSYLNSVIGNGTNLNSTLVRAATVNGTDAIYLNGTLPNGTTASGGTDDTASMGVSGKAMESFGWTVVGSLVAVAMWTL